LGEIINGFDLIEPLQSKNAGFSRWTFAKRGDRVFFLKEFLDPVYPVNREIGERQMQARILACRDFEKKSGACYRAINEASDGNAVRIEAFFRWESHYYVAMERVRSAGLKIRDIAALPLEQRIGLCRNVAHSISGLHERGVVHADLKDKNVLIKRTKKNTLTAKIIDFDCSFLEDVPPQSESELGGDQIYLSPEACLFLCGEETKLTTKMDVFSLGILFHQYLTGYVPWYDTGEFDYLHEAVLEGAKAGVSEKVPAEWRPVIEQMLIGDPEQRCSIEDVCRKIIPGYRSIDVNANAGNGFIFAENLGGL
jgi:serine/threonine protein kinase